MIAEALKPLIVSITSVKIDSRNARQHPKPNLDAIKRSLEAYGQRKPIVVNSKTGVIEAGNGLYLAAKELGWTEIAVVKIEDDKDTAKGYALMDNQSALLADWDLPVLKDLLQELDTGAFDMDLTGFDAKALEELMTQVHQGLTDDDAIPEQVETVCKTGQLWKLGEHRLLCGDATKREDVERLMDGEKADMVFTDPPYNVGFMSRKNKKHPLDYTSEPYEDDKSPAEWQQFVIVLFDTFLQYLPAGHCFYLWGGQKGIVDYYNRCPTDLLIHQNIVWDKQWPFLNRRDYLSAYESCIYGWRRGEDHYFKRQPDGENFADIWSVKKTNPNKMVHSAQKPVELIEIALKTSSQTSNIILDLFGGSGSTLIACEKLGRRCYMMEISEMYTSVILKRWEAYTGKQAVLVSGATDV